jgi:hypothetical protein
VEDEEEAIVVAVVVVDAVVMDDAWKEADRVVVVVEGDEDTLGELWFLDCFGRFCRSSSSSLSSE